MAEPAHVTRDAARQSHTPSPSTNGPGATVDGVEAPATTVDATLVARLADPRLGSASAAQRARLVQRAGAAPDAPAAAPVEKLDPHQDPKFVAVEQKIGQTTKQEKQHASARSKAGEAQAAAKGPPNDVASQAAAAQVDKMAQQKPGEFDKKAFIDAVKKAIEAAAPKNLEQADEFKKSDKAGQVKSEVSGLVGKGKQESEAGI